MENNQTDHTNMKLGKLHPIADPRTLSLSNYLDLSILPPAPVQYAYANNIEGTAWGMMVNDKINDCTCAAAGHLIMEWTDDNNNMVAPIDQSIIIAYAAISGYEPATGKNDNGAGVIDLLKYWRKTGIAGHKILAYTALQPQNNKHVMQSVYLFGGCYIGLLLPLSAKTQTTWTLPVDGAQGDGLKNSWGGHVVSVIGYDADTLTIVTWGTTKLMTWDFWNAYCDESYAIISADFIGAKAAPNGFDLVTLKQDLRRVTS